MKSKGNQVLDEVQPGTRDEFVEYYVEQSLSEEAARRFQEILDKVLPYHDAASERPLDVLDVGCGAGEMSIRFAELGHKVSGLDINPGLIEVARRRAEERNFDISFEIATAERLPVADGSQDVVVAPELLEHVEDWRSCLDEMIRVVRPGGVLFVSTTNVLCPIQQEFTLPLYSWYPAPVKRRCVELARTSKPEWVNHAEFPAFHWFSFYGLRRELAPHGFRCLDRFDTIAADAGPLKRFARFAARRVPGARFIGHVLTPYTQVVAIRDG